MHCANNFDNSETGLNQVVNFREMSNLPLNRVSLLRGDTFCTEKGSCRLRLCFKILN